MAFETKTLLIFPLLLLAACYMQEFVYGKSQVPCLFIFGDSLSDSGNNNNLRTLSKVNYKPYGIDFPKGPTGRFSNGLTSIDILAQLLGFEDFIPPFANTMGSNILKGVNYASGSAGIRNETGKHLGADIDLGLQLQNHKTIIARISNMLGGVQQASRYLNQCLYYVNIGSNDYINNYFLPQFYSSSRVYNPTQYAQDLIDRLSQSIMTLHNAGARKMMLVGIGPIGCTPNAIATHGSCIQEPNAAALIFSSKLKSLVNRLNMKFTGSKFIFRDSTTDYYTSLKSFRVTNAACCRLVLNSLCALNQTPCGNRNEYMFWDGFHPTSAANKLTALRSYNSTNLDFVYPMNVQQLIQS
ncbi:GDSL esterase/lipase At1g29670-like [Vicia villosa]|uniref:GDSL esterase/lipase At1g29670-like n=1 Tax=Vicia villosa TaxID=3911 RepID=UPI00273AA4EF|nr:GDSL esterase/lipase At1g29670-like [Vicia villosa]